MKNSRRLVAMLFLWVNALCLLAQGNRLYIPDVTLGMDNTATLCIHMDNEDNVAGLQFTLEVPEQVSLSVSQARMSDRAASHSLSIRKLNNGTYRVVIISLDNKTIDKGTGNIVEVPVSVKGKLDESADYEAVLSQVIMAAPDGNALECTPGSGRIMPFTFPDCSGSALSISPAEMTVEEAEGGRVRFMLVHEGYAAKNETFSVTTTADGRITLPSTITIRQGEKGAYFYAEIHPDGVLNEKDFAEITLSGENHPEACASIRIKDDTSPRLTLTADKNEMGEGETAILSVVSEVEVKEGCTVSLKCNKSARFELPATVVIPAGSTRTELTVKAIDDNIPDVENIVTFTASASGYIPASADIVLADNDVPALQLSLSKKAVSEAAGMQSVTATLSRTDNIDKAITVKLTDDSEGALFYSTKTVRMEAGTRAVEMSLGPIDNDIVDGERTHYISAGVYIASCSCSTVGGTQGGMVSVPLTIYDDDGPALSLSSASTSMAEGGETKMEIRRNAGFDSPLTVMLSNDNAGKIDLPKTVVIPAGETSAIFTVAARKNTEIGDESTVTVTAMSEGFSSANVWITITDKTLPDAQVSSLTAAAPIVTAGESVGITLVVRNTGLAPVPADSRVDIYSTTSQSPMATLYTEEEIAVEGTLSMEYLLKMPETVGFSTFYAKVNDDRAFRETDYSNNTSNMAVVKAEPPYSTEVKTDKTLYSQGETIKISGELKGNNVTNKKVEIYVSNGGYRHSIVTTSDNNGLFTAEYTPYSSQNGHFSVGACFPGEEKAEEQASFDIYGMNVVSSRYSTHTVALGDSQDGSFRIANPGTLGLTGIKAEITSRPEGCDINIDCPQSISGNSTIAIPYSIKPNALSPGNNYEKISITVTSDQGVSANYFVYFYCVNKQGTLQADIQEINTTITKGNTRDYEFTLTNVGEGETGNITFSLPSWMTTAMPSTLSSLKHGESVGVTIRMSQTDNMQLNVPVKGNIGINCTNGFGITLPFVIKSVSDVNGTLTVDACDDYTFNTPEAPHLAGATVTVKNPVTNALVCQGVTGDDGVYSVAIPEGYYTVEVTHEKHNSYSRRVLVSPEEEMKVVANLALQAVSIAYELHETEIPDAYRLETVVKCETNVPAPSIEVKTIGDINGEEMEAGESKVVTVEVTNNGLIEANGFRLNFPASNKKFSVTPLAYPNSETLAPNETTKFVFKFTKKRENEGQDDDNGTDQDTDQDGDQEDAPGNPDEPFWWENLERTEFNDCLATFAWHYWYRCGKDIKDNHGALALAVKACTAINITNAIIETNRMIAEAFRNYYHWPNGSTGGGDDDDLILVDPPILDLEPRIYGEYPYEFFIDNPGICDPCIAEIANIAVEHAVGRYGIAGEIVNAFSDIYEEYAEAEASNDGGEPVPAPNYNEYMAEVAELLVMHMAEQMADDELADFLLDLEENRETIENLIDACLDYITGLRGNARNASPRSRFSWKDEFDATAALYSEYLDNLRSLLLELYGDDVWVGIIDSEKQAFFDQLSKMSSPLKLDELLPIKPKSVSTAQLTAFAERMNNTYKGSTASNRIDMDKANQYSKRIEELDQYAIEQGYASMNEMYEKAYEKFTDNLNVASASVCADVEMKFDQTAVLTRQAFEGKLTIGNDMDTEIKDISVNLEVADEDGNVATSHEMQMKHEGTDGFTGSVAEGLALEAHSTGVMRVVYIPTKYAAPEEPKKYVFSGTVSYYDTSTDLVVTRDIVPVVMTVNPSPVLELNYFMQRDVLGDDPLTQDVIEPCLDAEFSLLVNNKGYGDANKLQFSTNTPEITANEKGIDWKFRMTEARLNGETAAMPLGGSSVVDFGNIPAHGYAYAQWFFKSSLLGHFTSYDISATHLSSHGNPDLSLIDTVSIHELTRSIQPSWSDEKGIAFLVNDIADSEDTPDALYLTDGSVENVAKARNLQVKMHQPETVVITMAPSAAGWNYGSLADPTGGQAQLVKVTRTDGTQIPLRNCWQTDRTLRDGKEPLYENLIHLVDECNSSDEVTYVLEFKPREDAYALEWNMKEGWNWVSSSLSQPIDIIGNFDNLERVQSQTSELVSDPVMGFTGNVTKMLPGLGYKIKVSRDCTTSVNGYKLDNTTPVTYMKKGWNWIGYPLCFRAGIDNLIGNAEEGDVITSQEGFTLFGEGRWDGSLKTLEAGKGYMYKSSSEKPLHFNMVEESGQTRDMADRNVPASRDVDIHKYPCTMNLVARVEGKGHTQSEDECTIFAMTGNECRGMSERIGDYYYITIYGEKAAEISFVVENHTTGTASLADNTIVFMEEVVGNRVSPYIISVTDYTGVQALSHEDKGMDIYAIDGMLVQKNASSGSIKSLPRGIYVIHGKKYAIW